MLGQSAKLSQIGGRTVKVNFPEVPMGGEQKVLETKNKTSYQSFMDTPNKIYAGNLNNMFQLYRQAGHNFLNNA